MAASFRFSSVICPVSAGLVGRAPCRASPAPTVGSCSLRVYVDAGLAPHGACLGWKEAARWPPLSAFRLSSAWGAGPAPCRASPAPTGGLLQPSRFRRCGARPAWLSPYGKRRPGGRLFPFSIPCGNQAASACSRRGPSARARPTMSTSRSSSASSMPKCGVKRSEFSPPWITLTPCMRSHSSVELAP